MVPYLLLLPFHLAPFDLDQPIQLCNLVLIFFKVLVELTTFVLEILHLIPRERTEQP